MHLNTKYKRRCIKYQNNINCRKNADKNSLRILIIGNAGCGKTFLSTKIGNKYNIPVIHMDKFFFKTGGYTDEFRVDSHTREIMKLTVLKLNSFIIEGADCTTAEFFVPYCNEIIFINYPWKVCYDSILNRPLDPGMVSTPEATEWLINWASTYYKNPITMDNSLLRHLNIFNAFNGTKHYLVDRDSANRLY